jgi:hypothetical protein
MGSRAKRNREKKEVRVNLKGIRTILIGSTKIA